MKTNLEIAKENVKGCDKWTSDEFSDANDGFWCRENTLCSTCERKAKAHEEKCEEVIESCEYCEPLDNYFSKECRDSKEAIKIYEDNKI